ncbi:hypothetical protein C8F01DRAFT_1145270 [Mycena amicta]|nr:hypothetical protein C8F01DRAFT_1145270 [Mycena amicta]
MQSSLDSALTTNEPPNDSDIPYIRQLLQDEVAELARLNREILAVMAQLEGLTKRQEALLKSTSSYKTILSPIRRVPPEILCAIFRLVATEGSSLEEGLRIETPWMLGHICRSWRNTALNYAVLWDTIRLHEDLTYPALQEQLQRTKQAPLRICVTEPSHSPEILSLILATSARWVALQLRNIETHDDISWMYALWGNLPCLERLELFGSARAVIPSEIFLSAPVLHRVLLLAPALSDCSPDIELPDAQITHYRGAYQPLEHFHVLRAALDLVECVLGSSGGYPEDNPIPDEDLSLPRLRTLSLENAEYLDRLTAPNLRALGMWSENGEGIQDGYLPNIISLVQRSACTLTRLALFDCSASSQSLVDLLRNLPTLTAILLETIVDRDRYELFDALTIRSNTHRDVLLPNLYSFIYGYHAVHGFQAVLQTLSSRSSATTTQICARITFFRLYPVGSESQPALGVISKRMKDLRESGVDAGWTTADDPLIVGAQWGDF